VTFQDKCLAASRQNVLNELPKNLFLVAAAQRDFLG